MSAPSTGLLVLHLGLAKLALIRKPANLLPAQQPVRETPLTCDRGNESLVQEKHGHPHPRRTRRFQFLPHATLEQPPLYPYRVGQRDVHPLGYVCLEP